MPNQKLKQIQVGPDVYDIVADSSENQNPATGALSDKFDWIGTQSEYIDQDVATNHPDWICYITDDVTTDSGEVDLSNYAKTSEVNSTINTLLSTLYPVGSLYIGTQSICPLETLIPNSTWELVSQDRSLQGSSNSHAANTTINAGLPNITGSFVRTAWFRGGSGASLTVSGAFGHADDRSCTLDGGDGGANSYGTVNFNASWSNNLYGASNTVQPNAYVVNIWRRTA